MSDLKRGDEVLVSDLPEWRHPITIDTVFHSGALDIMDKNGAWFRVRAEEVDDVVTPVEGSEDE